MYKTIEAIYKNGRVYPVDKSLRIKNARVLLTFIDNEPSKKVSPSKKFSLADLKKLAGSISLTVDPLKFQRKVRNEW